jgi:hypothetical protein
MRTRPSRFLKEPTIQIINKIKGKYGELIFVLGESIKLVSGITTFEGEDYTTFNLPLPVPYANTPFAFG